MPPKGSKNPSKWVPRTCVVCGKAFEIRACYQGPGKRGMFCSAACRNAGNSKIPFGRVERICEVCGATFRTRAFQKRIVRVCSGKCRCRLKSGRPFPSKVCDECGKGFTPKTRRSRFCSYKCWRSTNDKARGVDCTCLYCGKRFKRTARSIKQVKGVYCSGECRHLGKRVTKSVFRYRHIALRTYEKRCCDCGYDTHSEILVVHHVDRNRKNGDVSNLCVVCPNCHALRHLANRRNRKSTAKRLATAPVSVS